MLASTLTINYIQTSSGHLAKTNNCESIQGTTKKAYVLAGNEMVRCMN